MLALVLSTGHDVDALADADPGTADHDDGQPDEVFADAYSQGSDTNIWDNPQNATASSFASVNPSPQSVFGAPAWTSRGAGTVTSASGSQSADLDFPWDGSAIGGGYGEAESHAGFAFDEEVSSSGALEVRFDLQGSWSSDLDYDPESSSVPFNLSSFGYEAHVRFEHFRNGQLIDEAYVDILGGGTTYGGPSNLYEVTEFLPGYAQPVTSYIVEENLSFQAKFWVSLQDGDVLMFDSTLNTGGSSSIHNNNGFYTIGTVSGGWSGSASAVGFEIFDSTSPPFPEVVDQNDLIAPRVTDVVISKSNNIPEPYSFANATFNGEPAVGLGEQLRTVPVGGADTLTIEFDDDVYLLEEDLGIIGLRTGNQPVVADFEIDGNTATWTFDAPLPADQYLIKLSDFVIDDGENFLNGEWVNPATLSASGSSEFPSGDGTEGGDFEFVFTILPADYNRDNTVGFADKIIWQTYSGPYPASHANGDADGDGYNGFSDNILWYNTPVFSPNLTDLAILGNFQGDDLDVDSFDAIEFLTLFDAEDPAADLNNDAVFDDADKELLAAIIGFGIDLDFVE